MRTSMELQQQQKQCCRLLANTHMSTATILCLAPHMHHIGTLSTLSRALMHSFAFHLHPHKGQIHFRLQLKRFHSHPQRDLIAPFKSQAMRHFMVNPPFHQESITSIPSKVHPFHLTRGQVLDMKMELQTSCLQTRQHEVHSCHETQKVCTE